MLKGLYGLRTGLLISILCTVSWASFNTNGHKGVVRTLSGKTQGKLKLNLGLGTQYAQDSDFLLGPSTNNFGKVLDYQSTSQENLVDPSIQNSAKMISSNLFMNFGLTTFWDLGFSLPFYMDIAGFNDLWEWGLGDLEISTKILYPPPVQKRLFYQSYYLGLSVPTGSGFSDKGLFARNLSYYPRLPKNSNDQPETFYTTNGINFKPMMVWTFDIGNVVSSFPMQIHMNVGATFSLDFDKDDYNGDNTAIAQMALEYTPSDIVSIFVDVSGQTRWYNLEQGLNLGQDLLMLSPGIQIKAPSGLKLLLSGDFCLSSIVNEDDRTNRSKDNRYEFSTSAHPRFGFQFAVAWEGFLTPQDDDHDGLKNDVDRCPKDPEDLDGFEDSDGCPDYDNDNDGIPDSTDKCMNDPEDIDGFEDEDGCPDPDNDGDGIPDLEDECPRIAEDFDGIDDKDGCPDGDNDKDGIPDSLDRCPNDPEDFDNFEDDDGCPDIDNDKDGIPDLKDKCPNEPETFNGIDDEDGCPDKKEKKEVNMPQHQIMHGVNFKSGRSEMTPDSRYQVDKLVETLKEYPEVTVEVRGHTDSIGRYETNMRLSQERAESVRQYLIRKGVAPDRIRAVGYGPSVPVADNRTASGRAKNRRIEIRRTN